MSSLAGVFVPLTGCLFSSSFYISGCEYTHLYIRVHERLHTRQPITWAQRWCTRGEGKRLQQPSACTERAVETSSSSPGYLFAYLLFLNVIKLIKTAPFGSL